MHHWLPAFPEYPPLLTCPCHHHLPQSPRNLKRQGYKSVNWSPGGTRPQLHLEPNQNPRRRQAAPRGQLASEHSLAASGGHLTPPAPSQSCQGGSCHLRGRPLIQGSHFSFLRDQRPQIPNQASCTPQPLSTSKRFRGHSASTQQSVCASVFSPH